MCSKHEWPHKLFNKKMASWTIKQRTIIVCIGNGDMRTQMLCKQPSFMHSNKTMSRELLDAKSCECRSQEKRLQESWTLGYHKAMLLLNILLLKYYLQHRISSINNPLSHKIRTVFIITSVLFHNNHLP